MLNLSIVIHDFSILVRSTKDLFSIFELLEDKKVNLISAKENIDSSTPTGNVNAHNCRSKENINVVKKLN